LTKQKGKNVVIDP